MIFTNERQMQLKACKGNYLTTKPLHAQILTQLKLNTTVVLKAKLTIYELELIPR